MSLPDCHMTSKGLALVAKTVSGENIPLTRWQIGTGVLTEGNETDLTALINPLKYLPVSSVTNSGNKATIRGQFTNEGMDAFVWEELGLWATDPDEGEILFAVAEARGEGDTIEGWVNKVREFIFGMELTFSGTANVSAVIAEGLLFATKNELDEVMSALSDVQNSVESVKALAASMKTFYRTFELDDWSTEVNEDGDYELRIPQSEHGMKPERVEPSYTLKWRKERSALDAYGTDGTSYGAKQAQAAIIAAEQAAITAEYETDPDYGYPLLTWYQLQYYMLDSVLTTDAAAREAAATKNFDWQDEDITGATATCTLNDILKAAYTAALGGSTAQLELYATPQNLQGLRLRRRELDDSDLPDEIEKYDLHGIMTVGVWGLFDSAGVHWDLDTGELVITSEIAFPGDIMVNA